MDEVKLRLLLVVRDERIRERFIELLDAESFSRIHGAESSGLQKLPRCYQIVEPARLEGLQEFLQSHLGQRGVILLSDLLAERQSTRYGARWEPTSAGKELMHEFETRPLATISVIQCRDERVPEIDHTLPADFSHAEFLETLKLSIAKVAYLAPPCQRTLVNPVVIREIHEEWELREYFRLRYQVYRTMGYIEERLKNTGAELEVDGCDSEAVPIGAFEQLDARRTRLVGCARIVSTKSSNAARTRFSTRVIDRVAREHPLFAREVERMRLSLHLPIFHSANSPRLDEILSGVELEEKNCGELSRVIVSGNYRGTGLARLLIKFAIFKANELDVSPLLLECLEAHVPIYQRFGFRRIPGEEGRVLGVQKSMVAMELMPTTTDDFIAGAHVFGRCNSLCACHFRECYAGHYHLFDSNECPLKMTFLTGTSG